VITAELKLIAHGNFQQNNALKWYWFYLQKCRHFVYYY